MSFFFNRKNKNTPVVSKAVTETAESPPVGTLGRYARNTTGTKSKHIRPKLPESDDAERPPRKGTYNDEPQEHKDYEDATKGSGAALDNESYQEVPENLPRPGTVSEMKRLLTNQNFFPAPGQPMPTQSMRRSKSDYQVNLCVEDTCPVEWQDLSVDDVQKCQENMARLTPSINSSGFETTDSSSISASQPDTSTSSNFSAGEHKSDNNRKISDQSTRSVDTEKKTVWGLWCHQEIVKNSGLLEQLSSKQRNLQEALFEIITTEQSNLANIKILIEHFKEQLEPQAEIEDDIPAYKEKPERKSRSGGQVKIINRYEGSMLFSNIADIRKCSELLLDNFHQVQGSNVMVQNYLPGLVRVMEEVAGAHYVKYCSNIGHQSKILKQLLASNIVFNNKVRLLEEAECCQNKDFKAFLVLPMNRICHLPLLIEKIVKCANKLIADTPDDAYAEEILRSAEAAHKTIIEIAGKCNAKTQKLEDLAKQQTELVQMSATHIFPLEIKLNLITVSRKFIAEVTATEILPSGNSLFLKFSDRVLNLKLFNDILIFSRLSANNQLFQVLDVADVQDLSILVTKEGVTKIDTNLDLSKDYIKRNPVRLVCHSTRLGHYNKESGQPSDSGNSFQDLPHVFIFPPEERDKFVKALEEAAMQPSVTDAVSEATGNIPVHKRTRTKRSRNPRPTSAIESSAKKVEKPAAKHHSTVSSPLSAERRLPIPSRLLDQSIDESHELPQSSVEASPSPIGSPTDGGGGAKGEENSTCEVPARRESVVSRRLSKIFSSRSTTTGSPQMKSGGAVAERSVTVTSEGSDELLDLYRDHRTGRRGSAAIDTMPPA